MSWEEVRRQLKRLEDAGWEPTGWRGFGASKDSQEIWIAIGRDQ